MNCFKKFCSWSEKNQKHTHIYHARIILPHRRSMKSLSELSFELKIPYYKIKYAHQILAIPEPKKVGGIRVYDKKMIDKVRAYFAGCKNNP